MSTKPAIRNKEARLVLNQQPMREMSRRCADAQVSSSRFDEGTREVCVFDFKEGLGGGDEA